MSVEKQAAVLVPPGRGESVWLLGDTYTPKISGEQTGGAFTLLEAVVPQGGGPPPHVHHLEDEVFVVLEGELSFSAAGRTLPAPVGTVVYVPKGTEHSYAAVGTEPVRMLLLYVPAGMERMFGEIGTPAQPGVAAPPGRPGGRRQAPLGRREVQLHGRGVGRGVTGPHKPYSPAFRELRFPDAGDPYGGGAENGATKAGARRSLDPGRVGARG